MTTEIVQTNEYGEATTEIVRVKIPPNLLPGTNSGFVATAPSEARFCQWGESPQALST